MRFIIHDRPFSGVRDPGALAIELHDPEHVSAGKTLTSYMLTHGLSDQLTVGVGPFRALPPTPASPRTPTPSISSPSPPSSRVVASHGA